MRYLMLFIFAAVLALPAVGQEITTGVPIHPHPYSDDLPLMTWQCSEAQLTAGTYMLEFKNTAGSVVGYVDCNGNINGGGGGGAPGGPEYAVQFNQPLGTFDGVENMLANSPGQLQPGLDLNSGWALEVDSEGVNPEESDSVLIGEPESPTTTAPIIMLDTSGAFKYNEGYQAYLQDFAWSPCGASGSPISNISIQNDLLTVTFTGAFSQCGGTAFTLSNVGTATFLDGVIVNLLNVSSMTVTGYFNYSNYGPAADTGTVVEVAPAVQTSFLTAPNNNLPNDITYGFQFAPPDPNCSNPGYSDMTASCSLTAGFEALPQGDGENFEFQFDAWPTAFANIESSQFIDEDLPGLQTPSNYVFKVGLYDTEPSWWLYQDGSQYSRAQYIQQIGTTVGTCSMTPGLSDCSGSLASRLNGNGGPPATDIVNFIVCFAGTGTVPDTIAWAHWNGGVSCDGSNSTAPIPGSAVALTLDFNEVLTFASLNGHTLGASGSVTFTVQNGTEMSPLGGSFFDSVPLGTPPAPSVAVTCPTGCGTNWTYAVVQFFNGAPTELGGTTTVANESTLSGAAYNTITIPPLDQVPPNYSPMPGQTCAVMRTNDGGGSPSTTGYLMSGGSIIMQPCDSAYTVVDNGLAADGSRGPEYNTTGGIIATLFAAPIESSMQFITEGEGVSSDGSFLFEDQEAGLGETDGSTFTALVGGGIAFYGSAFETYLNGNEGGGDNFIFSDAADGTFMTNDRMSFGNYTVSGLAALSSPAFPQMAWVTDADTASTCTTAGGTYHNLCVYYNGAWVFIGNAP